ncbi:MAG TPA: hypothetical protein VFF73_28650 [Planctomycetota bacterium]|nr:hypothetical protein [Planctomycetota bacterium]
MADYYYLHEKPNVIYTVEAKPPPADTSKATFRANTPAGKTLHSEPALKKSGQGNVIFDLKAKGVKISDSPVCVEFTFEKQNARPPVVKRLVVLALAEPGVRAIAAPAEVKVGETLKVQVESWDARVHERPGAVTLWEEKQPGRIDVEDRKKVRWSLEGKALEVQGEKIGTKLGRAFEGRYATFEAWLGERPDPPGRATAQVAVPYLSIEGPPRVGIGERCLLTARIKPEIEGTFAWSGGKAERAELGALDGPTLDVKGLTRSPDGARDVKVKCAFTSKATGNTYEAEHELSVLELAWIELELFDDVQPRKALAGEPYRIVLPDGEVKEGKLDENGLVRLDGVIPGLCRITLPDWDYEDYTPHRSGWIEVELLDEDGEPLAKEPYRITLPNGEVRTGEVNEDGRVRLDDIPEGMCQVALPEHDQDDFVFANKAWVELEILDQDGLPLAGEVYQVRLPDGTVRYGRVDEDGLARVDEIPEGDCVVMLPNVDQDAFLETTADWIELAFVGEADEPLEGEEFTVILADGSKREGKVGPSGIVRLDGIPPGKCRVLLPAEDAPVPASAGTDWIELEFQDEAGAPLGGEEYELVLPDGSTRTGKVDGSGLVRIEGIPAGPCKVRLPAEDAEAPAPAGTAWIEAAFAAGDDVLAGERWVAVLADGSKREGRLDEKGELRLDRIPEGTCKITLPDLDEDAWDDAPEAPAPAETAWIELELLDAEGAPVGGEKFVVQAGGKKHEGTLDEKGRARVAAAEPGPWTVTFPEIDGDDWDTGAAEPALAASSQWLELELQDAEGEPLSGERFVVAAGETKHEGKLDEQGRARIVGAEPGPWKVTFPEIDQDDWDDAPEKPETKVDPSWIVVELLDEAGEGASFARYVVIANGDRIEGKLDERGRGRVVAAHPGPWKVVFPDVDADDVELAQTLP